MRMRLMIMVKWGGGGAENTTVVNMCGCVCGVCNDAGCLCVSVCF